MWVRTEPTVAIGRGLLTSVTVLGALIAVGVMWAVLTTDPGSATRRSAGAPLESFRPAPPPALNIPVGKAAAPSIAATSTVAAITMPAPSSLATAAGATVAERKVTKSSSRKPKPTDPSSTQRPAAAESDDPTDDTADDTVDITVSATAERVPTVSMPTVVVQHGTDPVSVAVPILDGHIALVSGQNVTDDGSAVDVTTEAGQTTGKLLMVDTNGVAIIALEQPADSPSDTGPTPKVGSTVRVALDGSVVVGTVTDVDRGEAVLDISDCPAGAPVVDRHDDLVGFCRDGEHARMMLTNAVDELADAVAKDNQTAATVAGTTEPTAPTDPAVTGTSAAASG